VDGMSPDMIINRVVFPQPDGPIIERNSFCSTSKPIFFIAKVDCFVETNSLEILFTDKRGIFF
jgi:hypothetical protein